MYASYGASSRVKVIPMIRAAYKSGTMSTFIKTWSSSKSCGFIETGVGMV